MAEFPKGIKNLINAFERLPGIGPKGATRLVFYLLNTPKAYVDDLASCLVKMKTDVKICKTCFSVSEQDICSICRDSKRNIRQICVVEKAIDVMIIENMGGFKGVYHVLGGVVNPLEHISPDDLRIDELVMRVKDGHVKELIVATNPSMEGDATALYLRQRLEPYSLRLTRLARGLPAGGDLEYADQSTLLRALSGRQAL